MDELDQNKCSVSHCTVSRNLLSRWRLAAIEMFKFPPHLPMNLHICPEAERDKWISGKWNIYLQIERFKKCLKSRFQWLNYEFLLLSITRNRSSAYFPLFKVINNYMWFPDLHLDPNSTGKIAVCSLHFKEGHPTPEFPSPTELLSTKDSENATEFRGTKATAEPEKVFRRIINSMHGQNVLIVSYKKFD